MPVTKKGMKLIHQKFLETVDVAADESVPDHIRITAIAENIVPSDELIAESRRVIEEGEKLHEQVQGKGLFVCDVCKFQASSNVMLEHLEASGHSGSTKTDNSVNMNGTNVEQFTLSQPGSQKPAVTAEQYARGREVLDALPPGVYLKCSSCHKWQMGGDIKFQSGGNFLCEKCG